MNSGGLRWASNFTHFQQFFDQLYKKHVKMASYPGRCGPKSHTFPSNRISSGALGNSVPRHMKKIAMLTKLTNLHGDATTMNNSAFCQHERYRMLLRTLSSCVSPHCSNPLIMRAENFQECDCLFLGAVSVDNCVCSCVSRGSLH